MGVEQWMASLPDYDLESPVPLAVGVGAYFGHLGHKNAEAPNGYGRKGKEKCEKVGYTHVGRGKRKPLNF